MSSYKPELRVKPPRCDEPRGPGSAHDRGGCPKCYAWDHYMQTRRRDMLRAGTYVSNRYEAPIMPAHRCDEHGRNTRGCKKCNAWARYQTALRRRAMANGTFQPSVDHTVATAHVRSLLDPKTGGWYVHEIVAVSGMSIKTVQDIAAGARTGRVFADTWNALRVLKPKGVPRARTSNMVDATEVRRIYQGLAAQGWTFEHMAGLMGRSSKNAATRCATDTSPWVTREKVAEARELRRKLGEYDIAVLAEPMPGMHPKCATLAARKGWVPLAAWTTANIGNPSAAPYTFEDQHPDDLGYPGMENIAYVDPLLRNRVLKAAQKLDEVADPADRAATHIDPIGRVTRLEVHALTAVATDAGMSSSEIGLLLGYPQSQRDTGERQVCRFQAVVRAAREWIQSDPHGDHVPDWFVTARGSTGRRDMRKLLPALLAVQVAPYGPGWTVAELAARCRVSEDDMREFLVWASTADGDRIWKRQASRAGKRRTGSAGTCVIRRTARAA
jgi:hypothetical protein